MEISSRAAEQVKIYDPRKSGSFKKIFEMISNQKQVTSWSHKITILAAARENAKNQL